MARTATSLAGCQRDLDRFDLSNFESATTAAVALRNLMQRALVFLENEVAHGNINRAIHRLSDFIRRWEHRDNVPEMNPHYRRFLGDYMNNLSRYLAAE